MNETGEQLHLDISATKTKETKEKVSLHPGEKKLGSPETRGNTSGAA
jgi:hypothetical protein